MRRARSLAMTAAVLLLGATASAAAVDRAQAQAPSAPATPAASCGPGSRPETGRQGRVPLADHQSGRAAQGFTCNTELLGHIGESGGYKVERYVDAAGHECAYFDTTLLFPGNVAGSGADLTGVWVLDMSNPAKPVKTANLLTPAMQSPHESLALNAERGLLVAVLSNPVFHPAVIDVYDVSVDCRYPQLKASAPISALGHESGFAPDGMTYYVAALHAPVLTAIDLSNPSVPRTVWVGEFYSHGLQISDDGNRAYLAARRGAGPDRQSSGLVILDVSEIQARRINPQVRVVSALTWPLVSTPQTAIPIRVKGHPYVLEVDEFASGDRVGAARIIDIGDERAPRVVSELRLEANQAEHRFEQSADPGASSSLQGYAAHYCNVPTRDDPGVAACTFIVSGLRLFDIRDPLAPKEIAYFNAPTAPPRSGSGFGSSYAMASPVIVPERGELWYSDGNSGFYALRVTNGVWPFAAGAASASAGATGSAAVGRPPAPGGGPGRTLPATGAPVAAAVGALALAAVLAGRAVSRAGAWPSRSAGSGSSPRRSG